MRRISDGTSGACQECGKPILPKRSFALPWAICCLDCQQQHVVFSHAT
jgi:RNA polymerase-binding transcription factor DksA